MAVVSLIELFFQQVERSPAAVAVSHNSQALSYAQLDDLSSRYSQYLFSKGVKPGDRVGICLERGLMVPIALLAVIKANACYVPLDPGFPEQRLQYMARDSGACLILVSPRNANNFVGFSTLLEGFFDKAAIDAKLAPFNDLPSDAGSNPQDSIYLIYTSGSTGTPKGVVMPQGAMVNLIQWHAEQPGLNRSLRTLQFTPISFDVHFQEFFGTWSQGGELVLIDDMQRRDAIVLARFVSENNIEGLYLPFVALQNLAEIAVSLDIIPKSLREVVTAGEQLQVNRHISEFFSKLPECRLHNHYGPSESHVVTAYTLPDSVSSWEALPPIGTEINNTKIYLLDGQHQPVEEGLEGEICIAGDCLSSGYWQLEDKTRERFVVLNLGGQDQGVYLTGDLGKRRTDGNIDYLGRIDSQIKISGYRIETGEIETAICEHPLIQGSAVLAVGDVASEKKLIAYLVLDADQVHSTDLIESLQRQQQNEWQQVWDGTYSRNTAADPEFDISGWNNSYSGNPIPEQDMRTWVDGTVEAISALKPRRVLEIGCGTGLIMFGVAPKCEYYHATDYSPIAIKHLGSYLSTTDQWQQCKATVCRAEDIAELKHENYDVIVMNSVTQHFTSLAYLESVLSLASEVASDGGSIFVGDVTNYHYREAFFADLEIHKAKNDLPSYELRAALEKRLADEQELVITPEWFYLMAERLDRVTSVEVRLKPGRGDSELTRYRFDVVLHICGLTQEKSLEELPVVDFLEQANGVDGTPLENAELYFQQLQPRVARLSNVGNSRVSRIISQLNMLDSGSCENIGSLKQKMAATNLVSVEPESIRELAARNGYKAEIIPSPNPGFFDAVFQRLGEGVEHEFYSPASISQCQRYASTPMNTIVRAGVIKELRLLLADKLPEYMLPFRYIHLSRLPLTPSGKLDRRSLPSAGMERPELEQEFVAASGEGEKNLSAIWQQLLDIDRVGIDDNFFDLGGNSILSVKVAVKIRQDLNQELSLVTLFQYPTIRSLAKYLKGEEGSGSSKDLKASARNRAQKQKNVFARSRRPSV